MQQNERRVYSPQLSSLVSAAVKRLAWALNKPMTKVIENLVLATPAIVDPAKVCLSCQDKTPCKSCLFGRGYSVEEIAALLAAIKV